MLDIAEVGAGGGSIVVADPLGTILVGPHSAGAVPGPVCYAAGGTRATVTDANVVLGFVNPEAIAGGSRTIHPDLARRAIHDDVAAPLGLSVEDAAHGVFGVATATMARAVKAVTTYRGRDPRDFALLAFGGNGPIFAAALAESLGMRHVLRARRPPACSRRSGCSRPRRRGTSATRCSRWPRRSTRTTWPARFRDARVGVARRAGRAAARTTRP